MIYRLVYTSSFHEWWETLPDDERVLVAGTIRALHTVGPELGEPYVFPARGSVFNTLRELHVCCDKRALRVFFGHDVKKRVMILVDGAEVSRTRYFDEKVPFVESAYSCYFGGYPPRNGVAHGL